MRLRASESFHCCSVVSESGALKSSLPTVTMPALLTSASMRPKRFVVSSTSIATSLSWVRSATMLNTSPDASRVPAPDAASARNSSARSWMRSVVLVIATSYPAAARRLAVANPMPLGEPHPVTSAVRREVTCELGSDARQTAR